MAMFLECIRSFFFMNSNALSLVKSDFPGIGKLSPPWGHRDEPGRKAPVDDPERLLFDAMGWIPVMNPASGAITGSCGEAVAVHGDVEKRMIRNVRPSSTSQTAAAVSTSFSERP
jgi:hypothetical protein